MVAGWQSVNAFSIVLEITMITCQLDYYDSPRSRRFLLSPSRLRGNDYSLHLDAFLFLDQALQVLEYFLIFPTRDLLYNEMIFFCAR